MNKVPSAMSRRTFLTAPPALALGSQPVGAAAAKPNTREFPKAFLWGAATAAYQIEGAATADGKGPSVWDVFTKKPGAVWHGDTGDVACDHYHLYKSDVALLKTLGVNTYRFSVSWPRVIPTGHGPINDKGLDFYKRLLDELAKAGITPALTLFHWDFPQALFDKGGWLNRDVADWFGEYAEKMARALADRVPLWMTQNEPQVYIGLGHLEGTHAPGLKLPFAKYLECAHNSMRAHGAAVAALRANLPTAAKIGTALSVHVRLPVGEDEAAIAAARDGQFQVAERNSWNIAWWTDPLIFGRYPQDGVAFHGKDMPRFPDADMALIKAPIDFLGMNIYTGTPTRRADDGRPVKVSEPLGYPRSAVDWQPIRPSALYWGPRFFWERYRLPIFITENGLSTRDQIYVDGSVKDPQRIDYTHRVLLHLKRAIDDGVPVHGYYAWSLLDNFEWADGYKQRFGLVFVNYATLKRTPKDSFAFYRQVIKSRGRNILGKTTQVPPDDVLGG